MKGILPNRARFGGFELDLKAGELYRDGQTVLLQEQPLQVLRMLVFNAGKLVTREEIQQKVKVYRIRTRENRPSTMCLT
jgi:DNA-binding winged helix-turn-helix (wHTH) protein